MLTVSRRSRSAQSWTKRGYRYLQAHSNRGTSTSVAARAGITVLQSKRVNFWILSLNACKLGSV